LTDFFAACLTADACNSDFYNANYFDGWSIGSNITIETTFVDEELVVVLENYHASFGFGAGTAGALTDFYSFHVPAGFEISATAGDFDSFVGFDTTYKGYGFESGWFGSPSFYGSTDTDYINFVSFQRVDNLLKVELADTETAWVLSSITADDGANEDTAITWAASASLTVPAAIVLAAIATL
jgi:hypothetical protein